MLRACAAFAGALAFLPHFATAALPETVERVKPSVVAVGTFQRTRSPQFRFLGTGFAIGDGTVVATNAHVVPEKLDADQLETIAVVSAGVTDVTVNVRNAKLLARDEEHDLALLRIGGRPLPALPLREKERSREGESLAFTGFPIGSVLGFHPATHRAVLAAITPIAMPAIGTEKLDAKVVKRLRATNFPVYQLDGTAFPGNSGSPLYDEDTGEVVGIINMVFVKGSKEFMLSNPSGITYAIPARHLRALLESQR